MLALVALGLVFRFKPDWAAVGLGAAAAEVGVSPQRLSRLTSRVVEPFEAVVRRLTTRGRPPHDRDRDDVADELAITRELLDVAAGTIAELPLRRSSVRERFVGAYERLRGRITQKRFCESLGISPRTFRHWRTEPRAQRKPTSPPASKPKAPRPKRPPRRGRFGFDVTLPDTQFAADTTDIVCLGVSLKLVAAQDIGGRDEALFDSVLVNDHESAEHVAAVFTDALQGAAGAQAITDQGTPYLAERAREALDALGVEHAPQKEADPTAKATIERAFRTAKDVARPLLDITNQIAASVPDLACPSLAQAVTTVVLTAVLRAYQYGARAGRASAEARGNIDLDELARRADASREQARATERSARLLLAHVHELYDMPGATRSFVNAFYTYPLPVLQDAERAMRKHAHRDDIRNRKGYFGAIVRNLNDEYRRMRDRDRRAREQDARLEQEHREHARQRAAFRADPLAWLRRALDLVAMQWIPEQRALLFSGLGMGQGQLVAALQRLAVMHGTDAAVDLAHGVFHDFRLRHADGIGTDGVAAVGALLERSLQTLRSTADCAGPSASAILARTGKSPRPPPPNRLRI